MQVELYADYEPGRLMSFLVSSQAYGLEAAAELCEHRGLVSEQVFVLGRMGNARQALELIISELADIPQVLHHRLQAPGAPHQCPSRSAGAWKGGSCSACEAQAVHAVCTASSVVAQPAGLEVCPAWNMAYVAALLTCACAMQAIEFVQMQRDDELWELLINLALSNADMTGTSFSKQPHSAQYSHHECCHLHASMWCDICSRLA